MWTEHDMYVQSAITSFISCLDPIPHRGKGGWDMAIEQLVVIQS